MVALLERERPLNEILINHLMKQLLSLAMGAALWAVAMPSSLATSSGVEDPCSDDCPLVWTQTLSDSSVECIDDLPTTCEEYLSYAEAEGLAAINACTSQEVALSVCFPLASGSEALDVEVCQATTAKRDAALAEGEYDANDGALRLYGLSAMGLADSDYFVEDPSNPLTFEHAADSRSARLTGTVHCVLNPNQIFHVDARFVNEDNAADWLAEDPNHSLLIADDPTQSGFQMCDVDTSAISVFDMQVLSRLTGAGDYEGTLFLDHMPMSYSKRFQLGVGANNHNCNQGFGGWFRWEGELNGEDVSGLSGDIVVDLECGTNDTECDEYAQFIFEAIDECGRILSQLITVERNDVTPPSIVDGPADMSVECGNVPAMEGAEAISATDNCPGDLDITDGEEIRYDGACPQTYILERRWTVTDICGNASVHVQVVQVQDTTAPELTIPADYTAECSDALVYDAASASDNCSEFTLEEVEAVLEGDCTGNYTITRTFTATDACGNASTAVQTITVEDTTAPEFASVPADYTVECSDDMPMDAASATDNCGPVTVTEEVATTPGGCAGEYILTRTFTATDDCGNSATAQQVITVEDTIAPEFTFVPADYTVECSDDMPMEDAAATDNCGTVDVTVMSETTAGDCPGHYTITRTFTATDDCGNQSEAIQTITVEDTTAPELSIPADYTVECSDDIAYDEASATDNCGEVDIAEVTETIAGDCTGNYTITRAFTATDECGNSTTATQTITVQDTTSPEFTFVPADYTVECSDDMPMEDAMASDNCGTTDLSVAAETTPGDCAGHYTITRTFTAVDDCGNSNQAIQTITVVDTTAPEISGVSEVLIACEAYDVAEGFASATDNCGDVSLTWEDAQASGGCVLPIGQFVRVYTATDDCGNSSTFEQILTLTDDVAPVFDFVPADYTIECDQPVVYEAATAVDNCSGAEVTVEEEILPGDCPQNYTIQRTFTATDNCDNASEAVQLITVQDTTAPELSIPADYTVECSDDIVYDEASATDNCGLVNLDEVMETMAGDCTGNYTITRAFTATDECGNSTTLTQTITVQDTTAPEFTSVPADYTVECSDEMPMEDAMAMDNCGTTAITVVAETTAGNCTGNYTITRTFTAVDDCGNSSQAVQTITVQDTTAPTIEGDIEVVMSCETYDASVAHATASDNCGDVTLTWVDSEASGGCVLPIGQYVRLYTATDDCGNASTFEQVLTLTDDVAPVFTEVPESYTIDCYDLPTYGDAAAEDNCSGVSLTLEVDTVWSDCPATYDIVRTWTAVDNCDNESTAVQTISVVDEEGPWFTFVPEDYTAECDEELVYEMPTAEDHCSEFTIEVATDTLPGPCAGNYVILREFIATDACGNVSETTQVIMVEDTTAPVFTMVPEDYTAECDAEHPMLDAEAMDACGSVSLSLDTDIDYNGCFSSYTITRTWTATDDCGNSSSATQVITIVDTTAPEFTLVPASYSVECTDEVTYENATAADNCAGFSMELATDTVFSDCDNVHDIVRTWTATDGCGNVSTASQTISVVDTTAPQLLNTCGLMNQEVIEVCCEALNGAVSVPAACDITFDDNCGQEASMTLVETYSGEFAPTAEVDRWCVITEPQALADGELCDGFAPHGVHLFNFPRGEFYNTLNGTVAHLVDGTMTYTMEVASADNPNGGYTIVSEFSAPMSWDEWMAQPGMHSYKSDCGLGDHTTWEYAMMTSGEATGWGDFEGDSFTMMHQPANGYFGFQIGEGANNKNANYGFSGWFYLSGMVDGQAINSSGDLFGELDCCQPWTLERAYTVTDCAGNVSTFTYEVHATGVGCEAEDEGGISEGEDMSLVSPKDLIQVLNLQPNPSNAVVNLQLLAEDVGTEVTVMLMGVTGEEVMFIYEGMVWAGIPENVMFDVSDVDGGLYHIQVTAKNFATSKKLLVVH